MVKYKNMTKSKKKEITINELARMMQRGFADIDKRFDKVETRLDEHDERFDIIDKRFDKVETKLDEHDERFDILDHRIKKFIVEVRNETDPVRRRVRTIEDYLRKRDKKFVPFSS